MPSLKKDLQIINKLGLHARAAATMVRVTNQFKCDVKLVREGLTVDAKSILGMMSLAAACGSWVTVVCFGDDAEEAMQAIEECINTRFGEDE